MRINLPEPKKRIRIKKWRPWYLCWLDWFARPIYLYPKLEDYSPKDGKE